VNENVVKTGIYVGKKHFFPGEILTGDKMAYVALIALPFNMNAPGNIVVEAVDKAGNRGKAGVPFRLLPFREHRDKINISDRFLQRKMPGFMARNQQLSGELLDVFLQINSNMRKANNEKIRQLTMQGSPDMAWQGSFIRMAGAIRANFADHRYYFYKGREIDQAFHMGVDIASVAHAAVPAANNGKIVFADWLGIYGNTVIIDHGAGLFSLYAHLSVINVAEGQEVKRGQIIGQTGFTGLAGGDHLHFAMLVHGVFVNPVEWWDKTWIKTHILANMGK
jgi:murein DD-endopeptidase MepM/ murein hydrolase activator NlpD